MSKFKFAMAMMVAGGAAAAAPQANAATLVTETFDGYVGLTDGTPFSYDITLAGATGPQFTYSGGTEFVDAPFPYGGDWVKHHLSANGTARLNPNGYSAPGLPSPLETIDQTDSQIYAVKLGFPSIGSSAVGDTYYHLTFDAGATAYTGYATLDTNHQLQSVTYAAAAVPEPDTWALLILGVGATGAVLRRRRQLQLAAA